MASVACGVCVCALQNVHVLLPFIKQTMNVIIMSTNLPTILNKFLAIVFAIEIPCCFAMVRCIATIKLKGISKKGNFNAVISMHIRNID